MSDWVNGNWSDPQPDVAPVEPSGYVQPQPAQYVAPAPSQSREFSTREIITMCLVVFLFFVLIFDRFGGRKEGGDKPDVKLDKLHMLILEESSERGALTSAQQTVLGSTPLRTEVKKLGGEFLLIDRDDISQLDSPWRDLANSVTERLPVVVIATPKNGGQFPIKDVETTMAKLRHIAGDK